MQCRRGYRGGIILKDVSLFVFLPPKNTVSESVQICKFLHSLLSEPLHGSRRRAHAVRNFAPGLLLEVIPTDHILLPPVQKPYVMRKPILLTAEIGVFGDQFFNTFSIELRSSALICCPFVIPPKPKCCPPGMRQHTKKQMLQPSTATSVFYFSIVRITQIPATNQVPGVRDFRRLCDRSAT